VSLIPTGGNLLPASFYTGGKFAASIIEPVANLPPASTTQGELVAKFAAGVVDTGGAP
jgi:hypothetical protein